MNPHFGANEREAAARLIRLALEEDLAPIGDVTSGSLIDEGAAGRVDVVARRRGVLAGLPIVRMVFAEIDPRVSIDERVGDGAIVERGDVAAVVSGPTRSLLTGERTALNFLTHLSGVATLTRRFVDAVHGTNAVVLDTRKTLPGWRVLQKYAVRCGGGTNHRMGLYDGVLVKDNHLEAWRGTASAAVRALPPDEAGGGRGSSGTIADAIRHARAAAPGGLSIEVEVDGLEQLADALTGAPDIVLLDNMDAAGLRAAVALRDERAPGVRLEASGGVTLENVAAIARTGVDRISIGALTHSAPALDLAFDWESK
jgi:nicotinate-nucleotide pyrophosphorylase (carboxylating)